MTIPTREQMDDAAECLIAHGSDAVAAYLKSPPKDAYDRIVDLLQSKAPGKATSLMTTGGALDNGHRYTNWTAFVGDWQHTEKSPDALIAAIHEHFKPAPVLVDNAPAGEPVPVVADPSLERVTVGPGGKPISVPPCNLDEYGVNTATYCADSALDLATAPLKAGDWVEVVGPSKYGAQDRGRGPWLLESVMVSDTDIDRFVVGEHDGLEGKLYYRSSLRGPVPAPKDAQ